MRRFLFLCSLTFVLHLAAGPLLATEACIHPEDSLAIPLASAQIDTLLGASAPSGDVNTTVCVFRNSQYQISAAVQISPIYLTGTGSSVDTVTTSTILARLRVRTVVAMISDGYITCTTSPDTVRVYHPISITRSGTGTSTTFAIASESLVGYFDYQYRYPTVNSLYPEVTLIGSGTVPANQFQSQQRHRVSSFNTSVGSRTLPGSP